MTSMEKLLEEADFSRETNHKNRLFYELFGKPVPITPAAGITLLGDDQLGLAAGGQQIPERRLQTEEEKREESE